MARYYYKRYTVNSSTTYEWYKYNLSAYTWYGNLTWATPTYGSSALTATISGYTSFGFDDRTGFTYSGLWSGTVANAGTLYTGSSTSVRALSHGSVTGSSREYSSSYASLTTETRYEQGSYIETVYGSYSYKTDNASDGTYWWIRGNSSTSYYRGTYVDEIIAEEGTYPANGISGSYWYVKDRKAFPTFWIRVNGELKTSENGWVKVDGTLRTIERMWVKVDGQLKEI